MDAHEIILSKDEQVANLMARSKTLNYILSPYKCELCYKGFVDTKAYENHKMKHDEVIVFHTPYLYYERESYASACMGYRKPV